MIKFFPCSSTLGKVLKTSDGTDCTGAGSEETSFSRELLAESGSEELERCEFEGNDGSVDCLKMTISSCARISTDKNMVSKPLKKLQPRSLGGSRKPQLLGQLRYGNIQ